VNSVAVCSGLDGKAEVAGLRRLELQLYSGLCTLVSEPLCHERDLDLRRQSLVITRCETV
jgi:hypothetical protein